MITSDEGLSPEQKIKQLLEQEDAKTQELEKKKKELEKKKKELEELEQQTSRDKEQAEKEIQEKIEEIAAEEKERFEELERLRKAREEASLEEAVAESEIKQEISPEALRGYDDSLRQVMSGQPGFYDITNYNVMNRLEEIAEQASHRALTKQEKDFVEIVEYHAERIGRNDFYKDKDESNYLTREMAQIDHINKMAKDQNTPKGEYDI